MGTSVIPMQSYAGGSDQQQKHKDTSDLKQSIQKDTQSAKANQHLDEENFCYRGDDCQQANQGQQIVGKDNDAAGFNDQSDNIPQPTSTSALSPSSNTTTNPANPPTTTAGVQNVTIIIDNSICKQVIDQDITPGGGTATQTGTETCTITLTDSSINTGSGVPITTPIITPNPTGAACPPPSVNAVLTTSAGRTLDVCVTF